MRSSVRGSALFVQAPLGCGLEQFPRSRLQCAQTIRALRKQRRLICTVLPAAPVQKSELPVLADGGILSQIAVGITRSPLWPVAAKVARAMLASELRERGVVWVEVVKELELSIPPEQRDGALASISDPDIVYPDYYLSKFHTYEDGNLSWQAAFEAELGTLGYSIRAYKEERSLSCDEASDRLRRAHLDVVFNNAPKDFGLWKDFLALDVGCGVGISTLSVAQRLRGVRAETCQDFRVLGVDASPYMLAVANVKHKATNVSYRHGLAETFVCDNESVDWYGMQFVLHELPVSATQRIFQDVYRVLKKGGVLSIADINPRSEVLKKLPAPVFVMLKGSEPFLLEYFSLDIERVLQDIGFQSVVITPMTPRHLTVVAVK